VLKHLNLGDLMVLLLFERVIESLEFFLIPKDKAHIEESAVALTAKWAINMII
jgi:hypothetical protein